MSTYNIYFDLLINGELSYCELESLILNLDA